MFTRVAALLIVASLFVITPSQPRPGRKTQTPWPAGYWPYEKSQPIIEKTQTIRLAPDLSGLSAGEKLAVRKLLAVGEIFQKLYEDQRHAQALSAYEKLFQLHMRVGNPAPTENLLTLYRLSQGPIATTLENKREPLLPVDPVVPGKNVYPWGVKKEEIEESFASGSANREQILDLRSVVRRASPENLRKDLATLVKYPVLDTLHPGLRTELSEITGATLRRGSRARVDHVGFYAVPYSVAYADQLIKAHGLLNEAADLLHKDDEEFARFLRNRARDLLSDDYESGDAAWVTGRFNNLKAQIG
jgi:hypothetical protein